MNARPAGSDAVLEWSHLLFGISADRQIRAQERIVEWGLSHVEAALGLTSADASIGAVLLVESIDELERVGVPEGRLVAKLRRDPDVWPTWAEIRAAGLLAHFAAEDEQLLLEADRAAGRHADFVFAPNGDEPRRSIEFKAIGLSDAEEAFSRRTAPILPRLLPPNGINTMHVEDTRIDLGTVPREARRHGRRQAQRLAQNLPPALRGISAAVVVGHGTEESYLRRVTARFREALDQLPDADVCWVAFHWSNGAPVEMVQKALAAMPVPEHVAGVLLLGSVAVPGRLENYLVWYLAPFGREGETQWQSEDDAVGAQRLFEIVDQCAGLRPSYIRVPFRGAMHDLVLRADERRIFPFNIVLAPDPPDLVPPRDRGREARE